MDVATHDCGASSVAAPFMSTPMCRSDPTCAHVASSHAAAPSSVMNLRLLN